MGKPRKGRKKRSTKRNSDYWFNPATGRQELKPHVLAKKRAKGAGGPGKGKGRQAPRGWGVGHQGGGGKGKGGGKGLW